MGKRKQFICKCDESVLVFPFLFYSSIIIIITSDFSILKCTQYCDFLVSKLLFSLIVYNISHNVNSMLLTVVNLSKYFYGYLFLMYYILCNINNVFKAFPNIYRS